MLTIFNVLGYLKNIGTSRGLFEWVQNNYSAPIVSMTKRQTKREMDGLHPKEHAGTVDYPGGCLGQNILEKKNSGRRPHLVGKSKEEEE